MVLFTLGTPFIHRVLFTVTVCTFSSLALTDIFPKLCSAVSYDQLWVCKSVDYWSGVSKPWENVCTSVPNSSIQVQGGPYIRVQHSSWRVLGWVPESICVYAPGGGGRGAQGMGWGFDCFCWLWGGAFDSSSSPGGGDIWTRRLGQRLRPIIDRSYVSHCTQCAVRSGHGNQYKVNA